MKSHEEQMAEIKAKKAEDFKAAQAAQNNNSPQIPVEQPQAPVASNPQPAFNLGNLFTALLQPGALQNFIQQNGGAEGIANKINQFTAQNSLPNVRPQDINRASVIFSTFDAEIEPGVKPSGEFSKHDPEKVLATKEANVRKDLAERIKLEGLTIELKKSVAELSTEAQEKLIKYHVVNFNQDKTEIKDEVIDFVKSGCLILDASQGYALGKAEESAVQVAEKTNETNAQLDVPTSTNSKEDASANTAISLEMLKTIFSVSGSLELYTQEIRALDPAEAASLIDTAFVEAPGLGGLLTNIYYQ